MKQEQGEHGKKQRGRLEQEKRNRKHRKRRLLEILSRPGFNMKKRR
jgi:hypothetical protein